MTLEDRKGPPSLVARKLEESFPEAERREARALLDAITGEGRDRVQLGMLKLCGGSLVRLQEWRDTALKDRRDIIASAEYPGEMQRTYSEIQSMGPEKAEEMREADRRQYMEWLDAGPGPKGKAE